MPHRYTTTAENAEILSHEADNAEIMSQWWISLNLNFPRTPQRYTTIAKNAEIISLAANHVSAAIIGVAQAQNATNCDCGFAQAQKRSKS